MFHAQISMHHHATMKKTTLPTVGVSILHTQLHKKTPDMVELPSNPYTFFFIVDSLLLYSRRGWSMEYSLFNSGGFRLIKQISKFDVKFERLFVSLIGPSIYSAYLLKSPPTYLNNVSQNVKEKRFFSRKMLILV